MGGETLQYHVTMVISRTQESAIKLMFKEKNWPCFMNILTDETVGDIVKSGFTNIFPALPQSICGKFSESVSEIKSDAVKILRKSTREVDTMNCCNIDYIANEEHEDDDTDSDDKNVGDRVNDVEPKDKHVEDTTVTNNNIHQTRIKRGSSKLKTLVSEKKERIFKNTKRRVKCPLCDLELATKSILKRHCLRRHPDEWFEFKCTDCPSMFKTQEELWKHRDEVKHKPPKKTPKQFDKDNHTPEELREMGHIQCNACGKFFHNDRMLRKHLYYAHRDMMPSPMCAVCNTQFKTRQELWKHKKETNHNDCVSLLKQYQCDMCGKVLKGGYYSFIHHQKLACGKKQTELDELKVLPCEICGATFKTKHQIRCHKNAVHLKAPEVCDICGNVYKNQLALRVHKKRHDETNRKYRCDDCGRSFFNNTLLKQHIRTHTKEKPFKCPMCNYTSACKENIGKHSFSVHKEKLKAIDLRKKEASVPSSGTKYMAENEQDIEEIHPYEKTIEQSEPIFHAQLLDRRDDCDTSVMLTTSEPATRSYVELMNCDINTHSYPNLDPRHYQYPWENSARR